MEKVTLSSVKCPKCGSDWDGGDIIENFKNQRSKKVEYWKDKTDKEIEKQVKECYSPPYRFSHLITITKIGEDHFTEFMCPDCNTIWNRYTGEEI